MAPTRPARPAAAPDAPLPAIHGVPAEHAPSAPVPAPGDTLSCDLFCAVIDNFGDVGVCWRLARQLSSEYGWQVRLLVDDLHTFARLCPALDVTRPRQRVDGIVVEHWHAPAHAGDALAVADIVIEAFACELPPAYVAAMARRHRSPVWLNLEYLSAEDWVAECHLKPSPHARYPLTKTFFFPGLGPGTGGVIKERKLDDARLAFDASSTAREAWWRQTTGAAAPESNATVISLFSYENPAVDGLLEQWRDGAEPIVLLVPEGRISGALARFAGQSAFAAGAHFACGSLRAHSLAFRPQPEFDTLLWASHLNFVRGEDSFVRAQWARRPFVWHIYPQADAAHLPKLDAALAHYARELAPAAQTALGRFWHAWNGAGTPDWADFWDHRHVLRTRAERWADELASIGDLAANLAEFAKSQLK
ncbi:elongation factor P maturation arginine rhamnosyltransferase EarP [Trinickia dinghuensis]|uniref:Protein-arginine rhamnosyltransferase n=1 Tax=Trinickia dinghuensis TaxID=2291023 RepID=A0A3D8JWS6_9BURK|nr:elongation factor P maturation arginine rhamnosyltransferase EarP [Trinickia dinghuensis]RDU97084.1 elongation factor P maturation arginine rhamnosyltransferase EarP [Trinickia dinghuensis]